jgi:alpha-amylase
MANGVMMQYFEWYFPADGSLWRRAQADAAHLRAIGVSAVWLPPAYKGQAGKNDVGYGAYDLYDLGEFDQKGSVATKYGTRAEYLAAIRALQQAGLQVYADIVFDHKMGADGVEAVEAVEDAPADREKPVSGEESIEAWTRFTFPGRHGKYSDFTWNRSHFDGVDWDQRRQRHAIYNFSGTPWDSEVSRENGNYDYLMGADLCFSNPEVVSELTRWGRWYLDTTGADGFRLDAVKHIRFEFFKGWLGALRAYTGRELFTVGEYWSPSLPELTHYLSVCGGCMSLFDVPLHFNFYKACSSGGYFDMRTLLDGTLVQRDPCHAVTFVQNHDTQDGQALQSVIAPWFLPMAYAVILLRPQGYPCVFYGDYYGVPSHGQPARGALLDAMLAARRDRLYGPQHDYFDHPDVVGWTLEGDGAHPGSGLAVLLTDGPGGEKEMYVGTRFAGQVFTDALGGLSDRIVISAQGTGRFRVPGGSVCVWVPLK